MKDGPDGLAPQRRRPPDSIWERYLTGKLSLKDKETLPALIRELHREIAQHIGKKPDAAQPEDVEQVEIEPAVIPPAVPKLTPIIEVVARRSHLVKRRPIDPKQN
ncbi:MAG TPA: hypothetical protein VFA43_16945 [Gemmatimonadaceae bacterium]|nr:hypothetical protein [Gemmatimonadaceae bacterium]